MVIVIKHIDIEGPGTIETTLKKKKIDYRIVDLSKDESLPKRTDNLRSIITLGGPMNVYEEAKFPFLKEEDEFLRKAIDQDIPVLGVCLGAQLLAKAQGAKVMKAAGEEIGWYRVNLTREAKSDTLFKGMGKSLDVFQWHQDSFALPKRNTRLLAEANSFNQAFRVGRCAWGLQFHFEVNKRMIREWIDAYGAVNKDEILNGFELRGEVLKGTAKIISSRFLALS